MSGSLGSRPTMSGSHMGWAYAEFGCFDRSTSEARRWEAVAVGSHTIVEEGDAGLRYLCGKKKHENRLQSPRFSARAEALEAQGVATRWGVPFQWNDGLLEVRSVASEELEWGQRTLLFGKSRRGICVARHRVLRRMPDFRPRDRRRWSLITPTIKHKQRIGFAGQEPMTLDEEEESLAR
ncbi:hypothetical protein ACLOJK_024377 [Asimina triloba]